MAEPDENKLALNAWTEVADGVSGAEGALAAFRDELIDCILNGKDFRRPIRVFAKAMAGHEWSWPNFDRWLKTFISWNDWPLMWEPVREVLSSERLDTEKRRESLREEAAKLIPDTVMRVFYARRRIAVAYRGLPKGWYWGISFIDDRGGSAERRVGEQFVAQIEAGDLSVVPPFFPGDRCSLRATRRPLK